MIFGPMLVTRESAASNVGDGDFLPGYSTSTPVDEVLCSVSVAYSTMPAAEPGAVVDPPSLDSSICYSAPRSVRAAHYARFATCASAGTSAGVEAPTETKDDSIVRGSATISEHSLKSKVYQSACGHHQDPRSTRASKLVQ